MRIEIIHQIAGLVNGVDPAASRNLSAVRHIIIDIAVVGRIHDCFLTENDAGIDMLLDQGALFYFIKLDLDTVPDRKKGKNKVGSHKDTQQLAYTWFKYIPYLTSESVIIL